MNATSLGQILVHSGGNAYLRGQRKISTSIPALVGLYPFYNKHRPVNDPAMQDPDYFEKRAEKIPMDDTYIDSLKGLWEEKIGAERELMLKATDNLIGNRTDYGLPQFEPLTPRVEYAQVDALKTAPESVRKIFSIEFGSRPDMIKAWKQSLASKTAVHRYDQDTYQAKIAWATACVRHWTALVDELMGRPPKNSWPQPKPKWLLHRIKLMVDYRRKLLRLLREQDEPEFERITKELKIAYHVEKPPEHVKTRKAWSEAQIKHRVKLEKERRLTELHKQLLKNREERERQIDEEVKKLEEEKQAIQQRLQEIDELEGFSVRSVVGEYQPHYVEEFAELAISGLFFGYPPPKYDADALSVIARKKSVQNFLARK